MKIAMNKNVSSRLFNRAPINFWEPVVVEQPSTTKNDDSICHEVKYDPANKTSKSYKMYMTAFSHGPNALKRIHNKIATNKAICTGLAGVLGKNANGSDDVIDYVLHTFGCVRGSDYARKLLAHSGKSRAGATRTTLEVKPEEMKKKRAMATPPAEVGSNRKKQKNDMWESVVVEDEFAVDDSFLKECAERLNEFVESRLADEDRLVQNEMDTDSEDEDDSEIGSYAMSEGENESE
jgi:hypothetical protein